MMTKPTKRARCAAWHQPLLIAAVEGRLPHRIAAARLFDAPVGWSR
jgi:hypothetical protein